MKIFNLINRKSISVKIIAGISLLIFILISVWMPFFILSQKKMLMDQLDDQAQTIAESVAIFCSYPLLIEDYKVLQDYIEKIKEIDNTIVMAEISRKDDKVVAGYLLEKNAGYNKKTIKYYVSSIKSKPPSYEVIGQFVIGISTSKTNRIIFNKILELAIISVVFLTFLAILINVFLEFIISSPIHKLDKFARELSSGNLKAKLILKNKDEFGRLSSTLDGMRKNLKRSYEKIKKQNIHLEETVEKRTNSLTQTNMDLEKSYQDLLDSQSKIIYMAFHDELTGLSNRRSCRDKMDNVIINLLKKDIKIAILYIGLDYIKNVNDIFGPAIGDGLLKAVAERLLKSVNSRGEVARWVSDEFVVLIPGIKKIKEGVEIAGILIKKLSEPFFVENKKINITASIGLCFYPDDDNKAEMLIKKSSFALYQAKKEGKNKCHIFDSNLYDKVLFNLGIGEELKNSVFDKELMLYYQPKVNLKGEIVDLEALIRWDSKKFGFVRPDEFIPIAENMDIILDIGNWVIKTVCRQIVDFQKKGYRPFIIAINLSPKHFRNPDLIETFKNILIETKCEAKYLEIEITESSAMEKVEESMGIIEEISKLGIKISIDDFGTGFSSFSRLIQLKFDTLKIDKSFIKNLIFDKNAKITVNSIISLAHNMNKEVVAEGVETEEQFKILKELNCDMFQGYLFGKPMKNSEIEKRLQK